MILGTNRRRIQGVVPLRRGDARRVPIPYAQHVNRDGGDPTGTPNVSTGLQHRGWMQRAACGDVGKRPIFVQDQATERHTPGSVVITIREYREMEAGDRFREFDVWDRLCELYGWPQSFWPRRLGSRK